MRSVGRSRLRRAVPATGTIFAFSPQRESRVSDLNSLDLERF